MDPSAGSEYTRKLNQQIVQKDNMIRLLQMKLKRHEEDAAGGADARVRELERQLAETEERLAVRDEELRSSREELMRYTSGSQSMGDGSGRVEQLEIECENLHDQLDHLRREVGRLEAELEKKDAHIEILRGEVREGQEQTEALRRQLTAGNGESRPRPAEEISEGESVFEPITRRIQALDLPRAGAEELRSLLREIRFELVREAGERVGEAERLRLQLRELEGRLEETDALRDRLRRVTDELERLRRTGKGEAPAALPALRQDTGTDVLYGAIQIMDGFHELYSLPAATDTEDVRERIARLHTLAKRLVQELQVEAVPTVGREFDSRLHEVAEYVRSREHEDGLIIDELRPGWSRAGEVIRPALVKVVKNRHTCTHCGNQVRAGSSFCDSCGNRLESLDAPCVELRNTAEMYWNTGRIFEEKCMVEKAREYYRQAVALEPENHHYLFGLGRVLEKDGEYGEALECFRRIPPADLRHPEAERHIRNILLKRGIMESLRQLGAD